MNTRPKAATYHAAIQFALNRAAREFSRMAVLRDGEFKYYVWPAVGLSVPEGWVLIGIASPDREFNFNAESNHA